jgi:hypothetical protein
MSPNQPARRLSNERGVALILSLFLVTVMSVLAASLMFLSQTETYATMNYRMMSQARYGAESGVHAAANYLLNTYPAVQPGTVGDALANYNLTVSPVTYNNQPVVLSAVGTVLSNYPAPAVKAAFGLAANGSLPNGTTTVQYAAYATLMSMQQVGVSGAIVQRWQIVSDGSINGAKTATVEVSSTLESQVVPGIGYGVFATGQACGSLTFSGSSSNDSYDSSTYNQALGAVTATNGGLTQDRSDVGTNGNMGESGNAHVHGKLYTPRTGTGTCNNGGGGIAGDALTQGGHSSLDGGLVQLPAVVTFPTPAAPNPLPPTTSQSINSSANCASIGLTSPTCTGTSGNLTINLTLAPVSLGNLSLTGGANITLVGSPGATTTPNFTVNSITLAGNSTITIQSPTTVVMNVAGKNADGTTMATPIDLTGGNTSNVSMVPAHFLIDYAGTGAVNVGGTAAMAAVIDAPQAAVTLTGTGDYYGAAISNTFQDQGNGNFHYDRDLANSLFATAGTPWLTSFSWKKN